MREPIVASKVANALVADAEVSGVLSSGRASSAGSVLDRFKERHGGLWVCGRVTLRRSTIGFEPNRLNRAVHAGDTATTLALADVADVSVSKGAFTNIVTVTAGPDASLTFRCYGAKKFANRIRVAATQAEQ